MLARRLFQSSGWLFLAFAAALLAACWAITASSVFSSSPSVLGAAVTLDMLFVVPLAYWALVVRPGLAPARTLIPIAALSILAASALVPGPPTGVLAWARYLIAPAEIGLLLYIVWTVRRVLAERGASSVSDPVEVATAALERALGNSFAAGLIASEFAVFYYALASWGRRGHVPPGASGFPPARAATVLAVLAPIVVIETVGVHLLVSRWSVGAAWILTALSAYTVLWVFGDFRAMVLRPTLVTGDEVVVRVGLRCSLRAPLGLIERAASANWRDGERSAPGHLNMAAPDHPNILIEFRAPVTAQRIFGVRTSVRSVGLRLQDPDGILRAIRFRAGNIAIS
ncbi:MAG: hypothetical protein ACKVU4_14175 [Phycisphaerales bacterium]